MYRTKQSISEHDNNYYHNQKFFTQQQQQSLNINNSGRLGVALPELQRYQKQCLQTNPTQRSDQEKDNIWNRKFMIKDQRVKYNKKIRQKLDYENSFSQNYSVDDTVRVRQKANLSAYMFGGFMLQDYNEQVNKLHQQLLKKVILNK